MDTKVLDLFVRVIKRRMENEQRTAEDIITEYTKLTDVEKQEILNMLIV